MLNKLIGELSGILGKDSVLKSEELKNHTTFKIGGRCLALIMPKSEEELVESLRLIKDYGYAFYLIGSGSNLLFSDDGIESVVIKLSDNFSNLELVESGVIEARSGTTLKDLAYFAYDNSLKGLEFASGIPGSVGGAVFMNAGAYTGEMKDVVQSVRVLDTDLTIREIKAEDLEFSYRSSLVQRKGYIVLSARFNLEKGSKEEIFAGMKELEQKRKEKQPLDMPSAGSVFKRPEGYYAGKLIQDSGLKGLRYRGAMVSPKHAGFIVNTGGASSSDVMTLIDIIRKTVYDDSGVMLEAEIRLIE